MAPCNALLSSVVSILGSYGGPLWKGNYAHLLGGFNTEKIWNYWIHIYIYNDDITIWIHMILLAYIRWTTQKKFENIWKYDITPFIISKHQQNSGTVMAHPLSVITTASTSSQMDSFAHRSHGLKATHAALKVRAKWSVYLFWGHDESWLTLW